MTQATDQSASADPIEPAATPESLSLADTVRISAAAHARKAELLSEATRQFCSLNRPGKAEITQFKEFFYQLIDGCGKAERRKLAVALSSNPYVPRPIIFYLAMDDKEVAAPVLLFSQVLNEADIVILSERLAVDHLQVLCRRDDLTPRSASALIANGGPGAAAILARNANTAQFTVAGLVDRKAEVESNPGESQVAETEKPVGEELVSMARRGGRLGRHAPSERIQMVDKAIAKTATDAEMARRLIEAARTGQRRHVAQLIAATAGCPVRSVANLLEEPTVEAVCVLLKGIGIDSLSASQLLLLLVPETGRSNESLAQAVGVFRRLNSEECREFVRMLGGIVPTPPAATAEDGDAFARAIADRRREVARPPAPRRREQSGHSANARKPFGKADGTVGR